MRNYVQPGDTLTLIAPYAVASGGGLLVGSLFGIAKSDAASGASVETLMEGVVDHAKATGAVTQGQLVYWDNTAKVVTTASNSGANKVIGAATQAAASADPTARVTLGLYPA